ncbi:MAG: tRNA pseudouridine(38-40) synthase TruA [Rickettsiaceae bacterium]|nr:tRNA pseudouridine(38-40) synthase TruA [Rickettsiaceae bacterium]
MYRYKIILEYLGTNYCGWQKQSNGLSLQQVIEEAIFTFSKEIVEVVASGRTDAGVHARGQVAHFDLAKIYEPRRLMHSINHFCRNHTIAVINCESTTFDFHARFSAKKRHYLYKILNRPAINIIEKNLVSWIKYDLDVEAMKKAAQYLIGRHDFSSFRSKECQANSPIKTLDQIAITTNGDYIEIRCSALSFLHHMVRNIVGSLILVGSKKWQPTDMLEVLESKDRSKAGPTAEACGLYFMNVDY